MCAGRSRSGWKKTPKVRECQQCGQPMESRSSAKKWCSDRCGNAGRNAAAGKPTRWRLSHGQRACAGCGELKDPSEFVYWNTTHTHCRPCEMRLNRPRTLAYYRANPLLEQRRVCIVCAKGFTPGGNNQKFCSQKCHDERDRRTGRRSLGRLALPFEQYAVMYEAQNGCCAVCQTPQEKMAVDHCHATLKIRRLLCRNCNLALGFVKENAYVAQRLVEYIETECQPLLEDKALTEVQEERMKVLS